MTKLNNFIAEFIGTFIFVSVILRVGEPVPIALALLTAIHFGEKISGGHYNPIVTGVMIANKKLQFSDAPMYLGGQVLGAALALVFANIITGDSVSVPSVSTGGILDGIKSVTSGVTGAASSVAGAAKSAATGA